MTEFQGLGQLEAAAGTVDVLHRLALGVEPIDAITTGPAAWAQVGRETSRAGDAMLRPRRGAAPLDPLMRNRPVTPLEYWGGRRFILRHGPGVSTTARIRVDDIRRRWVPRRFDIPLWTLSEVRACDPAPGRPAVPGFIPPASRLLRPWLLPGQGYAHPRGTTGARLRVLLGAEPVRWPRLEAFAGGGVRIGWAHGDDRGEVLLLVPTLALSQAPKVSSVTVAIRVHWPAMSQSAGGGERPADPLSDLVVEQISRSSAPPLPSDLDNDVLRGIARPQGYLTMGTDTLVQLTIGEVVTAPDITIA